MQEEDAILKQELSRHELFNNRFEWIAAVDWRRRTEKQAGMSTADYYRRKALVQAALRRLRRNFDDLFAA